MTRARPIITLERSRVTVQLDPHPRYEKMLWEIGGDAGLIHFRQYWSPRLTEAELDSLVAEVHRQDPDNLLRWPTGKENS